MVLVNTRQFRQILHILMTLLIGLTFFHWAFFGLFFWVCFRGHIRLLLDDIRLLVRLTIRLLYDFINDANAEVKRGREVLKEGVLDVNKKNNIDDIHNSKHKQKHIEQQQDQAHISKQGTRAKQHSGKNIKTTKKYSGKANYPQHRYRPYQYTIRIYIMPTKPDKSPDTGKRPATAQQTSANVPVVPVNAPPVMVPMTFNTQYLFPFPGQEGAPYFDGNNITQFLSIWEDLTIGWPEDYKVRRIPLYCKATMGNCIKALASFRAIGRGGDWESFKTEVLAKFKGSDEEQQKYTEGYLQRSALNIRNKEGSAADYHAFILDFSEKADKLLEKNILNEYRRVTLFLQAFSNRIGNKLCKKCDIDLDDPTTITDAVFENLKEEALTMCAEKDDQMSKLWRQVDLSSQNAHRDDKRQDRKEKKKEKQEEGGKKNEVDDLASMMKDLRIYQLEAQRKMEEQLAQLKTASNTNTGEKKSGLSPKAAPYVPPNQYGNRQWPQPPILRGCYWDGGAHSRDCCDDMLRAIERGEIHKRGSSVYLGSKDSGMNVRVPFPVEKDGKIVWQKEWVEKELMKKESEVNSTTLEKVKRRTLNQIDDVMRQYRDQDRNQEQDQAQSSSRDRSRDQERPLEYINGQPVIFRKAEVKRAEVEEDSDEDEAEANVDEKRLRSEKDERENVRRKKFAVEIPAPRKVLNRGEPMDVDGDEDMGASASSEFEFQRK